VNQKKTTGPATMPQRLNDINHKALRLLSRGLKSLKRFEHNLNFVLNVVFSVILVFLLVMCVNLVISRARSPSKGDDLNKIFTSYFARDYTSEPMTTELSLTESSSGTLTTTCIPEFEANSEFEATALLKGY
jgi:hypothetical protein